MTSTVSVGQMWRLRTLAGPMVVRIVEVHQQPRVTRYGSILTVEHISGALPHPDNEWRAGHLSDSPNAVLITDPLERLAEARAGRTQGNSRPDFRITAREADESARTAMRLARSRNAG